MKFTFENSKRNRKTSIYLYDFAAAIIMWVLCCWPTMEQPFVSREQQPANDNGQFELDYFKLPIIDMNILRCDLRGADLKEANLPTSDHFQQPTEGPIAPNVNSYSAKPADPGIPPKLLHTPTLSHFMPNSMKLAENEEDRPSGNKIYVSPQGTDNSSCGTSIGNSCKTIEYATTRAIQLGGHCSVMIEYGEYTLSETILISDSVDYIGGCIGGMPSNYQSNIKSSGNGMPVFVAKRVTTTLENLILRGTTPSWNKETVVMRVLETNGVTLKRVVIYAGTGKAAYPSDRTGDHISTYMDSTATFDFSTGIWTPWASPSGESEVDNCYAQGGPGGNMGGATFGIVYCHSWISFDSVTICGARGGDGSNGENGAMGSCEGRGGGGGSGGNSGPSVVIAILAGEGYSGDPKIYRGASGTPGIGGLGAGTAPAGPNGIKGVCADQHVWVF